MSARKIRRAAAHVARKAARKACFPPPEPASCILKNIFEEPSRPLPSLAEISPARLAANRANAKLSTGPSEAGRLISSQNRLTHGLARHNGVFKVLTCENALGFEALKQRLAEEHQPTTATEAILVNTMAESQWLSERALRLQDSCLDPDTGCITDPKMSALYLRYQNTHNRNFHRSMQDLLKLRAERRKAELGFEAQRRKEEDQRVKIERHEMKKQHHYWDLLRKDSQACSQIAQNTGEYLKGISEQPGFKAQYEAQLARHGLKQGEAAVAVTEPAA
jgi:hypothetical protein